jgi:hypothetical protein
MDHGEALKAGVRGICGSRGSFSGGPRTEIRAQTSGHRIISRTVYLSTGLSMDCSNYVYWREVNSGSCSSSDQHLTRWATAKAVYSLRDAVFCRRFPLLSAPMTSFVFIDVEISFTNLFFLVLSLTSYVFGLFYLKISKFVVRLHYMMNFIRQHSRYRSSSCSSQPHPGARPSRRIRGLPPSIDKDLLSLIGA